jgi:hypothetical protein
MEFAIGMLFSILEEKKTFELISFIVDKVQFKKTHMQSWQVVQLPRLRKYCSMEIEQGIG